MTNEISETPDGWKANGDLSLNILHLRAIVRVSEEISTMSPKSGIKCQRFPNEYFSLNSSNAVPLYFYFMSGIVYFSLNILGETSETKI